MKSFKIPLNGMLLLTGLFSTIFCNAADNLFAPSMKIIDESTIQAKINLVEGIKASYAPGFVHAVVEVPKGTANKWEVDIDNPTNIIKTKKVYDYMGGYPANYGYIPRTAMPPSIRGDDDPIDVIIIGKRRLRGEIVKAKILGFLNLIDKGEFDGKLVVAVVGSRESRYPSWQSLNSWRVGAIDSLVAWFTSFKGHGKIRVSCMESVERAKEIVAISSEAFEDDNDPMEEQK